MFPVYSVNDLPGCSRATLMGQRANKEVFRPAAISSLANGGELLASAELLLDDDRPAAAHALAVIAVEEFAKAFLLPLVACEAVPWHPLILRATRDHTCKQLLCVVMDHVNPDLDHFLARMDSLFLGLAGPGLSTDVADAINILRHEKIGRWESRTWEWAEEPDYHKGVVAIADGSADREKQDSLYVRLARSGAVVSTPKGTSPAMAKQAISRGRRLRDLVERVLVGDVEGLLEYKPLEEAFRVLFAKLDT